MFTTQPAELVTLETFSSNFLILSGRITTTTTVTRAE